MRMRILLFFLIAVLALSSCNLPDFSTDKSAAPTATVTPIVVSPVTPLPTLPPLPTLTPISVPVQPTAGAPLPGAPAPGVPVVQPTFMAVQPGGAPPPGGVPEVQPTFVQPAAPQPVVPQPVGPQPVAPVPDVQITPVAPGIGGQPSAPYYAPVWPIPVGGEYYLAKGEFPWCIARRFNLHPYEVMWLNGFYFGQIFYPGQKVLLPGTGTPYPGNRQLRPHFPGQVYTVWNYGETLRTIACYFGDIDPLAMAAANGLNPDQALWVGMSIVLP